MNGGVRTRVSSSGISNLTFISLSIIAETFYIEPSTRKEQFTFTYIFLFIFLYWNVDAGRSCILLLEQWFVSCYLIYSVDIRVPEIRGNLFLISGWPALSISL